MNTMLHGSDEMTTSDEVMRSVEQLLSQTESVKMVIMIMMEMLMAIPLIRTQNHVSR